MADQDELRLRIVPELDQQAKKQVEDDLNTISGNIPVGGSGGGSESTLRKARLADIRAEIDLIDLRARKKVVEAQNEIKDIQQRMSLNKLSLQEGARLIAEQEQLRDKAANEAIEDIQLQIKLTDQLNLTKAETANLERKAFFASERMRNGFTTMSGSMTQLTTNTAMLTSRTKEANIAFANFGRIVQDAPFGILGISNNIDPLLVSFAALKASAGGTTLALRSLLGVMMGPLGLIFLVGSVLPSALVVAERAMQRKKRATKEAKEEVDEFAEALKRAAGSQVGEALSASLSYTQQVDVLSNALQRQRGLMSQQVTETADLIRAYEEGSAALVQNGRISEEQSRRGIEAYKESLGVTREQDKAVRDIIQARLNEAEANLLVEQSIKRLNIPRQEENKLLQDANAETARRILLERQFIQIMSMRQRTVDDMLDSDVFDEFETKTEAIGRTSLETYQNLALQRIQFERQFTDSSLLIQQERDAKLAGISQNRLSLGLQDEDAFQQQRQLIIDEYAAQEVELARAVADNKAEQTAIYANAVASGLGAIFGENKAIQSAQVVIDTYAGAQKAFASLAPNLPLQIAAAGAVTAQGIATLRKINSTQKGTRSIGRASGGASSPSPQGRSFVTDVGAAGQVAGTIGPFGASMTPNISITANLDRQGLALAVRDGEADIATRQIPFAS
jgi:hypothetical protein